jgi:hypothetical protein
MPKGFKVSCLLLANMILLVDISNCQLKSYIHYDILHDHWDTGDGDSSYILVCKGKILLSILMACVMCLLFGMQEADVLEHTNAICHLCTL